MNFFTMEFASTVEQLSYFIMGALVPLVIFDIGIRFHESFTRYLNTRLNIIVVHPEQNTITVIK
jgi:hypothetical protein